MDAIVRQGGEEVADEGREEDERYDKIGEVVIDFKLGAKLGKRNTVGEKNVRRGSRPAVVNNWLPDEQIGRSYSITCIIGPHDEEA